MNKFGLMFYDYNLYSLILFYSNIEQNNYLYVCQLADDISKWNNSINVKVTMISGIENNIY